MVGGFWNSHYFALFVIILAYKLWTLDGRSYGLTLKKLQGTVSQWLIVVSNVLNNISTKVHQNPLIGNFLFKLPLKNNEKSWLILYSSNLIHSFSMTPYSVLVEIKVVRDDVIKSFDLHDQLCKMYSFHSKNLWSWQNSAIL